MIIWLISITKRDFLEMKIEIYHQIMGVIIKNIFESLFSYIIVWLGIALEKVVIERILMMCTDGSSQ